MRKWYLLVFACVFSLGSIAEAQVTIDDYLDGTPVYTVVASAQDGISSPTDLDFNRLPDRVNELWVANAGSQRGGSTVTLFNAGEENQVADYRKDSHSIHFMINCMAIAMSENGHWGSAQGVQDANGGGGTFTGPTLWTTDTTVHARVNQHNEWGLDVLLGSHLDMMHYSPYGMGMESDFENAFWYFDGWHGNICRYDFAEPHEYGGHDHSNGRVRRYTEIDVRRITNLPSHMVMDRETKMLYIVDNGNDRILRFDTESGSIARALGPLNETYQEYSQMSGAVYSEIWSGLLRRPCGIDYQDGNIIVSDNDNGDIFVFDVTGERATIKGRIRTGQAGIMGVKFGPDGKIWFVNNSTDQVIRIDLQTVSSVDDPAENRMFSVYPNPTSGMFAVQPQSETVQSYSVHVSDMMGRTVYTAQVQGADVHTVRLQNVPDGVYSVAIDSGKQRVSHRVVVQK